MRSHRLSPLLLLAAVCLAGLAPSPAAAAVKLHRCDLGAKRPLRCGTVAVPWRRADPGQGTTRIAFAVRPRGDRSRPSLGAVIAVDGGPGYSSTAAPFVRSVGALLAPLLDRRELVFVDERGTGLSGAIDCTGLQRGVIQEYIAIGQCADQLGPRYADYTTAEAAADIDAVRAALGRGRAFLYGDSYGTLLGQAYAVRFPQRLRGLILDSAYPGDDPYYRTLLPAGIHSLGLACRISPHCAGDAAGRFRRVVGRFHGAERTTEGLIGFLLGAGTLAPRSYLSLDEADRRFLRGEPRRLNRLVSTESIGHGSLREFSYGMEIAVECSDYPLLWDPNAAAGERVRQLSAALRGLPPDYFSPFSRREYLLSSAAHLTNCLSWPAPPPAGLEPPVPHGLEGSRFLPDPRPRRPARRRHLAGRGPPGRGALPALGPLRGPQPRPRVEHLLPVRLARRAGDSRLRPLPLAAGRRR